MRWKMFAFMTMLGLVLIMSVGPMKVAAQGLVEYALVLVVVGVGEKETAEIYFGRSKHSQGKPRGSVLPGDEITYTIVVTNAGDSTCTQTIEKPLFDPALFFGQPIQVATVSKGFGFVTFQDDVVVELEDECFKDPQSQRVVIQVVVQGSDRRFKLPENNSPIPKGVPVPYPVLGYSIVSPNRETQASAIAQNHLNSKGVGASPVVVGIGVYQNLNLHLNANKDGLPAAHHPYEPGLPGVTIVLQNPNPDTGNEGSCTQTIQVLVNPTPGLQTLTLGTTSGEDKELLVNGVFQETLDNCFDKTERVVYSILGDLNSFQFSEPASTASRTYWDPGLVTLDITDNSGATAASVAGDWFGEGVWLLDVQGR